MTAPGDPRLSGRKPEFSRMSRCSGIGASAMVDVATAMNTTHGALLTARLRNAPGQLMHGRSSMPLGRYLTSRLRTELGLTTSGNDSAFALQKNEEMRAMRAKVGRASFEVLKPFVETQRCRQVETRAAIYAKKVKL
ncbi:MAG: replication initiator protein [Microviridae sp.]|nr:MAG: replication initiator protein [Microviridae sp.]